MVICGSSSTVNALPFPVVDNTGGIDALDPERDRQRKFVLQSDVNLYLIINVLYLVFVIVMTRSWSSIFCLGRSISAKQQRQSQAIIKSTVTKHNGLNVLSQIGQRINILTIRRLDIHAQNQIETLCHVKCLYKMVSCIITHDLSPCQHFNAGGINHP